MLRLNPIRLETVTNSYSRRVIFRNLIGRSLQDIDFLLISLPLCMRKRLLDLVLGGNPWVEFSKLLVLGAFLQESYSTLARARNQCHSGFTNDEIAMTFEQHDSSLDPQCQIMMFEQHDSNLASQCQQKFLQQDMIVMTSMIELESLFVPLFDEYFNGENQVVTKCSAVPTADASDKRQQQPYSTSSTSTLATTVTADENFDL
ncbi:hypothetical protein Tco_1439641 [Tanacetum coccineum]